MPTGSQTLQFLRLAGSVNGQMVIWGLRIYIYARLAGYCNQLQRVRNGEECEVCELNTRDEGMCLAREWYHQRVSG